MYDVVTQSASFWQWLIEIDEEICGSVRAAGCPLCEGPLDRGDYERKPRGVPAQVAPAFSRRLSLCCRWCRKRVAPPSVRFLGRKVYVGAIMVLATMGALVCGAARRTLVRWRAWWTTLLPATTFWQTACSRLLPAVPSASLPGELLQRFERSSGGSSTDALVSTLRFLQPISSRVGEHFEGGRWTGNVAQKMRFDRDRRDLLRSNQIPTKLN